VTLKDEFNQFNELEYLIERMRKSEALLNATIPFLQRFYKNSAPSFGMGAQKLIEAIYTHLAGSNEAPK